jgi:hypothetical protein
MHNSLKIIKTLLYSYSVLHVSSTLAPIIRSLAILHIQPPVTVCRWVGCNFQLWSVTTVAFVCCETHESDSSNIPKLEDTTNPTTHGDWRLYVQNCEAPDDGRNNARNM